MFIQLKVNWEVLYNGILAIFSVFGLCPISLKPEGKKKFDALNWLLLMWSFVHVLIVMTVAILASEAFYYNANGVSSFNNVLKFSIMALTHFAALVESTVTRNKFVSIWKRVDLIDDMIGKILQDYKEIRAGFFKATARKIIVCLLLTIVIEIFIISHIWTVDSWKYIWLLSIVPLSISRLRHIQHTLYIDLLTFRFCTIKNELNQIVKFTKLESSKLIAKNFAFYDGLFKKITIIKTVYNTLWETSLFINRSFGVSQLANLLQNFIQLSCDLYLVYNLLYNNNLTYIIGELDCE